MAAPDRGFTNAIRRQIGWLSGTVVVLLLIVGCSKPLFSHLSDAQAKRWEHAVAEEARKAAASAPQGQQVAPDFGRELDTLTSFYETIISVLLGLLALVAGLAFWTIKVVTKAQAEETAMLEATRILGDHDNFRTRLATIVKESVDRQMEEVRAKLERLEEGYVPPNLAVDTSTERRTPQNPG